MFGKVSRIVVGVSLLAVLAACTKTDSSGTLDATQNASGTPAVVQGACPQIFLREGTSVHRTYAKGGKDDPAKVTYQASLADTTRQCVLSGDQLVITAAVQGRVLAGPAGGPGTVTLPIRVAVVDGEETLYSQLFQHQVELTAGNTTSQFVFSRNDVAIPGGSGSDARIYIGFDEGPYNTQ